MIKTRRETDLTADEARRIWSYDPLTGAFTWRIDVRARKAGEPAGTLGQGYWRLCYQKRLYLAHRVAWLMTYGHWPLKCIDHINRDSSDNRIENLRDVDQSTNMFNVGMRKHNTSGFKNVRRKRNKWVAEIVVGGRQQYLGAFDTPQAAALAVYQAKAAAQ